ncbi:hypothetical protein J6590_045040 [Homalodisca vitripennis]|nr:hypothetical protein J6590_045040 [Homalodisca vitripennis]
MDNGLPNGGARPKEKKRGILKNYENGKVVERVRRGRKTPEDPTEDSEKENDLLPPIPTTSSDNGLPSGGARPKEKKRGILKNYENGKVVERVRRGRKTPVYVMEDVEEQSRHDIAIGLSTDKCVFPDRLRHGRRGGRETGGGPTPRIGFKTTPRTIHRVVTAITL